MILAPVKPPKFGLSGRCVFGGWIVASDFKKRHELPMNFHDYDVFLCCRFWFTSIYSPRGVCAVLLIFASGAAYSVCGSECIRHRRCFFGESWDYAAHVLVLQESFQTFEPIALGPSAVDPGIGVEVGHRVLRVCIGVHAAHAVRPARRVARDGVERRLEGLGARPSS